MTDVNNQVALPTTVEGPWKEYQWLVITGCLFAFAMAWAIGANDVGNAFGTTVGAKTITLWQACIIAAIFEFSGSVLLGGEVTRTIAGSITSPQVFDDVPEVFAYGMLCALIASWLWVTVATYLELAVSTTHSMIGAIIGFGLVHGGSSAITWYDHSSQFPFVRGLLPVVISWFASPVVAGCAACVMFLINRTLVLRRAGSHEVALWAFPPLVLVTITVNVFFVLYKGADSYLDRWGAGKAAWVSAAAGTACALLTVPFLCWIKFCRKKLIDQRLSGTNTEVPELAVTSKDWRMEEEPKSRWQRFFKWITYSLTVDVHEDLYKDERVTAMHSAAEVFDPRAEEVYKYLQVFSSCCVSFAHGANDVANAIGPLAGIWYVYNHRAVSSSTSTPKWILALGGAGLVIGLATYGYNIIKVLGVKMAKITPSRGYCAEMATALTVSMASVYGLPVSTTHCIVGAEAGVGLVEGFASGTNWLLLAKTMSAWAATLAIAGVFAGGLFAFGLHTPNTHSLGDIRELVEASVFSAAAHIATLNDTNWGNLGHTGIFNATLDNMLTRMSRELTLVQQPGPLNAGFVRAVMSQVHEVYASQAIPVIGFNRSAAMNDSMHLVVPRF